MDTARVISFEDYVRNRQDALLRSARKLTASSADAQDLLQTAFVRTLPAWEGISDKRHADAYLRRVLINTRTTLWRSRKLDEYPTDELPDRAVDDGSEQRADRAMLDCAMNSLSKRQRSVVHLRYYEGMSTAETAAALGMSLGSVKSTLHRSLARMRVELERYQAAEALAAA
jgi:RNA polymerase sigma-70 factor (sigma-E family)